MSKQVINFHLIGDPHISDRHINLSQEAIDNSLLLVKKNPNVDFVVVMGDVLDRHNSVKQSLQYMAHDWVKKLAALKPTFVLIGNHDREHDKKFRIDVHPFMGLEDWRLPKRDRDGNVVVGTDGKPEMVQRLTIVNKPVVRNLKGSTILFMPFIVPGMFTTNIQRYLNQAHEKQVLTNIKSIKDFDLIFAHQEFKGASYGPIVSTRGDDWPLNNPMVISGHIHTRTFLQSNIYYVGSLYPTNVSESYDKGVITGSYDPLSRKFEASQITRVVMEHKRVFRIDASNMDQVTEMVALDREGVRYVVRGTREEIAKVKGRVKGSSLNVAYDIVLDHKVSTTSGFDDILRQRVTDPDMIKLLGDIMNM